MDCQTKIKELRESTGMNRTEFCDYFPDSLPYGHGLGERQQTCAGLCSEITGVLYPDGRTE